MKKAANNRERRSACVVGVLALALVAFLVSAPAQGQRAAKGVAEDKTGELYVLDGSGSLRKVRGPEASTPLQQLDPGAQLYDLAVDGSNNLVVPMQVFDAGAVHDRLSGRIAIYDWSGRQLHEVRLPAGWSPQRTAVFDGRIVVLASSLEEGFAFFFLDPNYTLVRDGKTHLPFDCVGLDFLTLAVDGTGIWVAPRERCQGGYVARKFDGQGRIVAQVAKVVDEIHDRDENNSEPEGGFWVTPVICDIFVVGAHIGVVLNHGTATGGTLVDVWTTAGEFVKRVEVPARLPDRAVGMAGGAVVFLGADGRVVPVNIRALLKDQP